MKKLLSIIAFVSFLIPLKAQSNYCGTLFSDDQMIWLRNFQNNYIPQDPGLRGGTTYYIPMKVHIVGNDDGIGYYNHTYLYTSICELNEHFAETGFVFYIYGELDYIDNSDFYEHDWYDGEDMMDENNVNDLLNVYFVSDPAGNCGYFSPSDNGVAVAKSCAMPGGTTIAHEFGHFFSLPHTFYGWEYGIPDDEDQEWVNGANCNSAADGFCDTPPDYLDYRWNCPGPLQTDPNGDTFFSDGTYYMSYSNDACTDKFSIGQQDAMIANLLGPRNDMLDFPTPVYVDLTETPTPVVPLNNAVGLYPNYVYLEWTPVENATQYHLQISYSSGFSAIAHDVVTTNNFYEEKNLQLDKKYYWRVRPLSPLNTCEAASLAFNFTTGSELTAVQESEIFNYFSVYPNPASSASTIDITYQTDESFSGTMNLLDITGKTVMIDEITITAGSNKLQLNLPELSEGIYFIQLNNGNKTDVLKLMINN